MQDKHSLPWHHAQICVTRNFNLFAGNMTCDLVGGEGGGGDNNHCSKLQKSRGHYGSAEVWKLCLLCICVYRFLGVPTTRP